jgi:hypothetical protein
MRSFALRRLVGYERSVHRRSNEVLKRILKRSDFDRKPILLAERGTGLVCHNPERGPTAIEALRYWPVVAVFVENKKQSSWSTLRKWAWFRWACNLP